MKDEIMDLFTKRLIDYSLIDFIELIILFSIIMLIIAIIKAIIDIK